MSSWICDIPMVNNNIRVRVRGIFSTALTKLFMDMGYQITQPSPKICSRFNIENPTYLSPHIDIQSKGSRAIVEILQRFTDRIRDLFLENFDDVVIQQHVMIKNSIWKGIITKKTKDGYIVRYSINNEGFLHNSEAHQPYQEGDLVIVEIKDYDKKNGRILLTDTISIPGEFVVLIKKETIKVSRKIRGSKKIELMDIGNILRPPGWGAIFRTSAMYATTEEISEEMNRLKEHSEELIKKAEKAPAFSQIREGINIITIYFPLGAKKTLDSIRSQVAPTIRNHHWLKAVGRVTSYLVDFIEDYLSNSVPLDMEKISDLVMDYVKSSAMPKVGDVIKIFHIKPSLRRVILGPAKIIEITNINGYTEYILFRKFSPGGHYDGINAPKETGDYGVTIAREYDTKLITAYFDMNSNLKGIYININTPIEIYPNSIRYIDLEVDVVRTFNGEVMILDRQKLQKYRDQKVISQKLFEKTQNLALEYKNWLESEGTDKILEKCEDIKDIIASEITF